jgi:hypothetical protein
MTDSGTKQNLSKLEQSLLTLYGEQRTKIVESVGKRCKNKAPTGISQMIGRRYGFFWEELIKRTFESNFQNTNRHGLTINIRTLVIESIANSLNKLDKKISAPLIKEITTNITDFLDEGEVMLSDFLYESDGTKRAIEIKWRVRWNDAKTVKIHVLAAHRLKSNGYEPIMLIRTEKNENFESTLERFERAGWKVITGVDTKNFIKNETNFDLSNWIKTNVKFWTDLRKYHTCLKELSYFEKDFLF